MSLEPRVDRIEEAILIMKELLVSQSGRLDDYYKAMRESREDFEFKLNALINAQMTNETEIIEVKESIIALKEVSQSHSERIENLESKNNL